MTANTNKANNGNRPKTATELVLEEDFNSESARNQILNAPRVLARIFRPHGEKRSHFQGAINGVPFSYQYDVSVSMPRPVYEHIALTTEMVAEQGVNEDGANYLIPHERPSVAIQLLGEDKNALESQAAAQEALS